MILLPVPPSTNHLFATFTNRKTGKIRRVPTKDYDAWREHAGQCVKAQRPQPLLPSCKHIGIKIVLPDTVRGDIDNRVKGIADLLVSQGLIPDDRYVQDLSVKRLPRADETVLVEYWAMEAA